MKRLISIILCVLLCITALAGCGDDTADRKKDSKTKTTKVEETTSEENKKLQKDDIIDSAIEFWNDTENFETDIDMVIKMSAEGQSMTTRASVESLYDIRDNELYAKTTMTQNGQSETVEAYVNMNSDGYSVFVGDGTQWYKQTGVSATIASENGIAPEKDKLMMYYLECIRDKSDFSEDDECYIFSSSINASNLEAIKSTPLKDYINLSLELGMTEEEVVELFSLCDFKFVLYIEKETFAPVKMEADMAELMDAIMSKILALSGAEGEISIDQTEIICEYSNFNKDFEIDIPSAALNAPEAEIYK